MDYNVSMTISSKALKVQDIMSPIPRQVTEDTPVEEVYNLFSQEHLQCVPVVDENGCLQGCIFLSDLERSRQLFDLREYLGIIFSNLAENIRQQLFDFCDMAEPIDLKAREIMSVRLLTTNVDEDIATLSKRMVELGNHFALVVDNENRVRGMVTSLDILKVL